MLSNRTPRMEMDGLSAAPSGAGWICVGAPRLKFKRWAIAECPFGTNSRHLSRIWEESRFRNPGIFTAKAAAYSVAGDEDIVVVIRVSDHESLADLVTGSIAAQPGVLRTRTLIAFRVYSQADLESI